MQQAENEHELPERRRARAAHVADLQVRQPDSAGAEVLAIYARNAPDYAVYRTADRVCIHFADNPAKSNEQRKALAQLSPPRGEINGYVDRWRASPDWNVFLFKTGATLRAKAERYDRRVADALIVGLEGDLTGAGALLASIRDDIIGERIGWARFEYLVAAYITAFVLTLIAVGAAMIDERGNCGLGPMLCFKEAWDLWLGSAAGAFGAFFSIALAIRGRTVLPDLYRTSNLMDAALRIIIGTMAGAVLVALLDAQFIRFSLGESSPDSYGTIHILVVGFIAGFAERLVPDLLAKGEGKTGERPVIRKPEPELDHKAVAAPATAAEGGASGEPTDMGPDPLPAQADVDSCIADIELADDETTPDEALPPASGGVAREDEDQEGALP